MECLLCFGITPMKQDRFAQLSGRGELHGGARVITLVTWGKRTLNFKRTTKMFKSVSTSTKGLQGGLGLDLVLRERHGSDVFLLPPGVLVHQASRTKE